ncbi:MAG: 3-isopropylmalate dehydratase large subunit [Deltaproteobacteria bacterium]|jgi:3-isopropylmalate/(R)-2-methylmalate dehydratase large subunit|nr:3-isopropylmalate dehydratase large subunit [Deltaproteobacteria bacterium]
MHALEKILAQKAGKTSVKTGEIVNCTVDKAGINDLYLQTVRSFHEIGASKVALPERVIMFMDHYAPASTSLQADNQRRFREFCRTRNVGYLMDVNEGVCHQVMADKGLSLPGELIVITDSHTTTHGAFGAFGTGVGATDMATILATGKLWFRVPEIMRIRIEGTLPKGVYAKDVILHIIGRLGADYAVYKGVEFAGPVVGGFSVSERMALCNMSTEMGAKATYIHPDAVTLDFLKSRASSTYTPVSTDADFTYAENLSFDVSNLKPQVAAPSSVDNVFDLDEYAGTSISQAYLGSCTGGRLEDIAVAASILRGKKIAPGTRLLVVPASRQTLLDAVRDGYLQDLVHAGATFVTPSCAACLGTHQGLLADGEICISSTNRNFPGRMGSTGAEIYLGSPASVAAAALEGKIVNPLKYL